jgi:hypothetical protein
MRGKIFISYRRDDSIGTAGRLNDRLVQTFGRKNVFMDVDQIPAGVDFARHLNVHVADCDVFLAVIGPGWLDSKDGDGARRLDSPEDFVRVEILAALGRSIRVIPVLVDGAEMPSPKDLPDALKPLARRNAVEVRNVQFGTDVERLIGKVREALGSDRSVGRMRWSLAAAAVAALLMVGGLGFYQQDQLDWLLKRAGDVPKGHPPPQQASKAAPTRYVRVNNGARADTVVEIFAQPSVMKVSPPVNSKDWLPGRAILPGKSDAVHFEDGSGTCIYDLRATSQVNGREWVAFSFDVCKQSTWDLGNATCRTAPGTKATNDGKERCVQIYSALKDTDTIDSIYAVPSARKTPPPIAGKNWILGDSIRSGKSLAVNFDDGNGTCVYDLRVKSKTSANWLKFNFDVCNQSTWQLVDRRVEISNNGNGTVMAIYAVPSTLKMPRPITGKNWVPAGFTIGPGQSHSIDFDDGNDTCLYDLRATSDKRDWNEANFDVCERSEWNLEN